MKAATDVDAAMRAYDPADDPGRSGRAAVWARKFAYASLVDVQYDPTVGSASLDRLVGLRDAFERQAQGDTRVERPSLQTRRDVGRRLPVRLPGQVVGTYEPDHHVLEETAGIFLARRC
jgi:hypothetical protein